MTGNANAHAEAKGNPMHAPPAGVAQRGTMSPPPQGMPAPIGYANPQQPPMNQAGLLTQTGFHNAALGGAAQAQQQAGSLQLSNRGAAQAASGQAAARPAARPKAPPRPAGAPAGKALEGTRFRPRNQTAAPVRSQPRATPSGARKGKEFTMVLVGLGVVVVGVLAWVAASFF